MSVTLLVAATAVFMQPKPPSWYSPMLAGYLLENDESHRTLGVYDKEKNFYLVRGAECDGAILTMVLTRDRKVVSGYGYRVPSLPSSGSIDPLKEKPLPSLETGKGVKIGDTQAQVRKRLGSPTKVENDGDHNQFRVLQYEWIVKGKEVNTAYEQRYVFKENRLIEIHFTRSAD